MNRPEGSLADRVTQHWVRGTGQRVLLADAPWLDGPRGDVDRIGTDFFHRYAERHGFRVESSSAGRGLLSDFSVLDGPECVTAKVHPAVAQFYEQTAAFDLDVWSEWSGLFRPFGSALASIFSRRLQQLNVPLSPLDTSRGISSTVLHMVDGSGTVRHVAWVREVLASRDTLYAGSYST